MKYYYFASFGYRDLKKETSGFGCCEIPLYSPVTHFEQIQIMINGLQFKNPTFTDIIILNYQLLRTEDKIKL